jgi:hypothetical protein
LPALNPENGTQKTSVPDVSNPFDHAFLNLQNPELLKNQKEGSFQGGEGKRMKKIGEIGWE